MVNLENVKVNLLVKSLLKYYIIIEYLYQNEILIYYLT